MAYNTKYILSYCNKDRIPLRIELQLKDYVGETFLLVDINGEEQFLQDQEGYYLVSNIDGEYNPERDKNPIEGGANPFTLKFNNDDSNKGGTIRAQYVDMEFYEDILFNIDDLATSDETAIKCIFYYNNQIEWIGFVTPDFFSVEITENPLISLTASDRIGILKDIDYNVEETFNDENINFLKVLSKCLLPTELNLNINVSCNLKCNEWVSDGDRELNAFQDTYISERRFKTTNGVMNCYDVLKSVCDEFNCLITQYKGEWWIVNKEELELGLSSSLRFNYQGVFIDKNEYDFNEVYFALIDSGGTRTKMPAVSQNTMLVDHGETQIYPRNSDLYGGITNIDYWTKINTVLPNYFIPWPEIPLTYTSSGEFDKVQEISINRLKVPPRFVWGVWLDTNEPHLQSQSFKVVSPNKLVSDIEIDISLITKPGTDVAFVITLDTKRIGDPNRYVVLRDDGDNNYVWTTIENRDGYPGQIRAPLNVGADPETGASALIASEVNKKINTRVKKIDSIVDIEEMEITVNIYGVSKVDSNNEAIVNHVTIRFNKDRDLPKGTVYQNRITGNFTTKGKVRTVLFGDYLEKGQNGFFYQYPKDSLSIMYNSIGELTSNWTGINDLSLQPLIVHAIRQQSRSFGNEHDELRIGFDMNRINPFSHFAVRCFSERYIQVNPEDYYLQEKDSKYITTTIGKYLNSKRFVLVEGKIDYLRSHFEGVLAQIRTNEVERQEYIYSYFEQGDIS